MKKSILVCSNISEEDDHQSTVEQRAFETVLGCLDEPLHVALPASFAGENTKKTLNTTDTSLGVAIEMKEEENERRTERRSENAGDVSTMCRD